ncbi:MAG: valine--tRNA ligase [Elusimicrobia bacterium]|nr:valine--tRNA ligase [Candidatus Liberimonas magnetica]
MVSEISKVYEPKQIEDKWYKYWIEHRLFNAKKEEGKKPFTIVIPPPNVTGSLHMGHALNNTLQDIAIRFKSMQGFNTLWVPGTDHGGIATQNVVEKQLISNGKTRHDLGREKFIERMWQWRKETGDNILKQLEKLGCSLDLERTRFTLDEVCSRSVMIAFVGLYKRGLIYRGKRLVNWCPRCNTALADIEVEHEEELGKLWHIQYPLIEEKEVKYIVVATTRPETMLGDTAVAVHPEDKRYKKLIGKKIKLPLIGREIPIISDEAVDPTFGTGAVKVTPAHDPTDFDIGARHKLSQIVVIDYKGKMTVDAGPYAGLDRYAARKKVLEDLETKKLLLETTNHPHSIGHCYRCNTVIEPLVSEQWFLKVEDISKRAMEVVEEGKIKFYPKSWEKPYLSWLENLRDWCISRQIWWGHRIPVYYCKSNEQEAGDKIEGKENKKAESCPPIVSYEVPTACPKCGGTKIEQDPDVLDTWFSSALWPFSVFGWPKTENEFFTSDLHYFYPTSVLVTGHEILYLWVARMVQMGLEFMGDVPFREVFIHGIVRDKFGKKMSKSLGNVIDPLVVIDKYGADALRFSLTQSAAPGKDMQLSDDSFVGARNFTNKLWNASRFVFMNMKNMSWEREFIMAVWPLELADQWILSEYRILVKQATDAYNAYDMDTAARLIYDFFWSKYCDWYIEISKIRLNGEDENKKRAVLSVLSEILSGVLKLAHPIMPFITEELWQALTDITGKVEQNIPSILKSAWPEANQDKIDQNAIKNIELIQGIVTSVRTVRSEMNVPPGKGIEVLISVSSCNNKDVLTAHIDYLKILMKAENIIIGEGLSRPEQSAVAVTGETEIFIPLKDLIDPEKEKQRLTKELGIAVADEEFCKKRMENMEFVARAPQKEIEKIQNRLNEDKAKIEKLNENLKKLE